MRSIPNDCGTLVGGVVPAKRSEDASKLIQAGSGVWSERVAKYDRLLSDLNTSKENDIWKSSEGLVVMVFGPDNGLVAASDCEMFVVTRGASSLDTIKVDSMFATAPADPAAITVKDAVPTSRASGVPESVPVFPSIKSQEGFSIKEYSRLPESELNVVGAN
jgi:hypothetical protein